MQKYIARVSITNPNGSIGWGSNSPTDCIGMFAKVQNCPIGETGVRLTCYATNYADTYWTQPAVTRRKGVRVTGFFSLNEDGPIFTPHNKFKHLFPCK